MRTNRLQTKCSGGHSTPRLLTSGEVSLIHRMLPEGTELSERLLKDLAVTQVEDVHVVGMGGVRFLSGRTQLFGCDVATTTLADADGVPVIATLRAEDHDQIFELELWKVDFSPIIGIDLRRAFSEH